MTTLGIIGLGKIGGNLAVQAVEKGITVIGKDVVKKPSLTEKGVTVVRDYEAFFSSLEEPRIVFLSLPAGLTIDTILKELSPFLKNGDVVLDGGNSFFLDSIRREREMWKNGVYFLDCGTSGGLPGARSGACFMVGGKEEGVKRAEPILMKLAVPGGYVHTGRPGSGHFVKLVHNGIEFGMLQAIGEGVELLKKSDFSLDIQAIFKAWSHGSVIRGWLIELMEKGLGEKSLESVPVHIEDTGEVNWLVHFALNKEIPIPVIAQSIMELFSSRNVSSEAAKAIQLMRHGFGHHPFGKNEDVAAYRKTSRVEKI